MTMGKFKQFEKDLLDIDLFEDAENPTQSSPIQLVQKIGAITIDNNKGIGETPSHREIGYKSFVVYMPPRAFLKLTPNVEVKNDDLESYAEAIKRKGVAMPWLDVKVHPFKNILQVIDHEGRHRCQAIQWIMPGSDINIPVMICGTDRNPIPTDIIGWKLKQQNTEKYSDIGFTYELTDENIKFDLGKYKWKNLKSDDFKTRRTIKCINDEKIIKIIDNDDRASQLLIKLIQNSEEEVKESELWCACNRLIYTSDDDKKYFFKFCKNFFNIIPNKKANFEYKNFEFGGDMNDIDIEDFKSSLSDFY